MDENKDILQQIEEAHLLPTTRVLTEQDLIDILCYLKTSDDTNPGVMIVNRKNKYLKKYFGICAPKWMKVKLKRNKLSRKNGQASG